MKKVFSILLIVFMLCLSGSIFAKSKESIVGSYHSSVIISESDGSLFADKWLDSSTKLSGYVQDRMNYWDSSTLSDKIDTIPESAIAWTNKLVVTSSAIYQYAYPSGTLVCTYEGSDYNYSIIVYPNGDIFFLDGGIPVTTGGSGGAGGYLHLLWHAFDTGEPLQRFLYRYHWACKPPA